MPANHVLLATIYVAYGSTVVTSAMIGMEWTDPVASVLTYDCSCSDCSIDWNPGYNYDTCTVYLRVRDQYGYTRNDANGETVEITMYGSGTIKGSQDADYHDSSTKAYSTVVGSVASFSYKRDQTEPMEYSPIFACRVLGWGSLQCTASIFLGGNPTP